MPSDETHRVEKLTGDNEDWHYVGATNDFGVDFENSWANQGGGATPARFYKDKFNRVYVEGIMDTGATGNTAFTLPVGYRPDYEHYYIVNNNNAGPGPGGASVRLSVDTDGSVVPRFSAGTNIDISGVSFRVA